MEKFKPVTGIAFNEDEAKVTIQGVPDKPGYAAKIFSALADKAINVDMIIQSELPISNKNDITFTVSHADINKTLQITQKIVKEIKADKVVHNKNVAKISIIGVGMISTPGIAAKMFSALGKEKINIELITTSEIKISCVIRKNQLKKAVSALHKIFNLHK
jgi:aspartate kinase